MNEFSFFLIDCYVMNKANELTKNKVGGVKNEFDLLQL